MIGMTVISRVSERVRRRASIIGRGNTEVACASSFPEHGLYFFGCKLSRQRRDWGLGGGVPVPVARQDAVPERAGAAQRSRYADAIIGKSPSQIEAIVARMPALESDPHL